ILAIITVAVIAQVAEAPLAVIGELPTSLPAPSVPDADLALLQALIGPAFAVAALTAIESLLSARVASGMTSAGAYDGDRERVVYLASGLVSQIPMVALAGV
ncbi:SulP family inorganic anion transporter, partial [Brevibacterium paucivorans]